MRWRQCPNKQQQGYAIANTMVSIPKQKKTKRCVNTDMMVIMAKQNTEVRRRKYDGNYVETAPFALIGLFALAMMSAHSIALHLFGAVFLLGRILHAHGMAQPGSNGKGRVIGMMMTLFTFFGTALYLLWLIFTFQIN